MAKTKGSRSWQRQKLRKLRNNKPKSWCQIYGLRVGAGEYFYVGQTRLLLEQRLDWHFKAVRKKLRLGQTLSPAQKWIYMMMSIDAKITIDLIDGNGIWDISEAVWIDRLRAQGHPLRNVMSVID